MGQRGLTQGHNKVKQQRQGCCTGRSGALLGRTAGAGWRVAAPATGGHHLLVPAEGASLRSLLAILAPGQKLVRGLTSCPWSTSSSARRTRCLQEEGGQHGRWGVRGLSLGGLAGLATAPQCSALHAAPGCSLPRHAQAVRQDSQRVLWPKGPARHTGVLSAQHCRHRGWGGGQVLLAAASAASAARGGGRQVLSAAAPAASTAPESPLPEQGCPAATHLGAEGARGHLSHSRPRARVNHTVRVPLQHGAPA